jgi:predicted transcriptional regulator
MVGTPLDVVDMLQGRAGILEELLHTSSDKPALLDNLAVSRSTLDRAIRELESADLVAACDEGIELTLCGRLLLEEHRALEARMTELCGGTDGGQSSAVQPITAVAQRAGAMEALLAKPRDKRALMDELDVSRSTVDRATRELEALGVVEYMSGELYTTEVGRTAVRAYAAFEERVAGILEAQSVLSVLDPAVGIDSVILAGAEVVPADDIAPFKPGEKLVGVVRKAEHLRMTSRAHTYPESKDVFHNQIVNEGMTTEIVFRTRMLDYLRTNLEEGLQEILLEDDFEGYVTDTVPFGLYVAEWADTTKVCVLVYGPDNHYTGLIINDREAAIEWGKQTFDRYKRQGERIDA